MPTLWFVLLGLLLTVYVVLDGFDLGVGALHLFVAKSERERAAVIRSIGPVWDGNEVWLIAAGGTLFFAFPALYARSFSGFYLPLMMVLWLLAFRAIAIELRHQVDSPLWRQAWDVAFAGSSSALALFFGVALGNVLRGVPLDADGRFFEPLWTDFSLGAHTGVLDWYTLLVGVTAVIACAHHGALWLALKLDGEVNARARALAGKLWVATLALVAASTAATVHAQPLLAENLQQRPWGGAFALLAVAGLVGTRVLVRRERFARAFYASAAFLAGMMASAAFAVFPYVLPGRDPARGLTAAAAASPDASLSGALWWWLPALVVTTGYFVFIYRKLPRTFSVHDTETH